MSVRSRARRGEGRLLRDEILDAAERLLIETGDEDAVSIRAIASAVGVTPPSLYLHFADKEHLLFSVCERQFALFDRYIEDAVAGTADPVEELRARARAYVRFGLEHPDEYRILFMGKPTGAPDGLDVEHLPRTQAFAHQRGAVQRCIDADAFRAGVDPYLTAVALWNAVHGITSLRISLESFPWPELDAQVDHLCSTLLRGLAADPQV